MMETQALLGKIAALRQRLEQARGLVEDAGSAAASLLEKAPEPANRVRTVEQKVVRGSHQEELLEGSLRWLPGVVRFPGQDDPLPPHLTARARRLLPQVRDLLSRLRGLAEDPLLFQHKDDPLAVLHRELMTLAELAVRVLQNLPETPSSQVRLCEGIEAVVRIAGRRLGALTQVLSERQRDKERVDRLAELLLALNGGRSPGPKPFRELAEAIREEAAQGMPLRFPSVDPLDQARFVACHGLMVARVMARINRHLPEWRGQPHQPLVAAMLHDVGMLRVPAELLALPGKLDEAQRRTVEGHAAVGAEIVGRLGDDLVWLKDAAAGHHERLDGTGYPGGLSDLQIAPLVRLLAVCDVYAALCCDRPHRPALDPRTALTDTLLLAQQGGLDSDCAKALLELGLYPAGTAVELADGAVGVVVATHQGGTEISACSRPVVALLADSQGQPLPVPHHLDLGECEGRSIVRGLTAAERRQLLGGSHPEYS
jgi:HD-GYP domain-containing protein (c-di-GMP phosphodiesterase class II)